jgi:hypothetical protein
MSRWAIGAIVVVGAAILVVGGLMLYGAVLRQGDQAFEGDFMENCLTSARETLAKQGSTGPEVESRVVRYCNCALDVIKPLSPADKIALRDSEDKRRQVLAEVQKRCQ